MSDALPPDPQDDPLLRLPRSVYYQVVHDLHEGIPAVADVTPEALEHRIHAAIASVASMLPANAEEAGIAARCVIAHARSIESLRTSRQHPDDPAHFMRCTAQSAAMMRTANSSRSLLLRVQATRQKREADPAACDKAAWIEHCAVGLMDRALRELPPAPPPPPPTPAPPAQPATGDRFVSLTEAEQYAVLHPRRTAQIRALGRLPDNCSFGPPPPELVDAIVASTSPIMLAIDQQKHLLPA